MVKRANAAAADFVDDTKSDCHGTTASKTCSIHVKAHSQPVPYLTKEIKKVPETPKRNALDSLPVPLLQAVVEVLVRRETRSIVDARNVTAAMGFRYV